MSRSFGGYGVLPWLKTLKDRALWLAVPCVLAFSVVFVVDTALAVPQPVASARDSVFTLLYHEAHGWDWNCGAANIRFEDGQRRLLTAGHCVSEDLDPRHYRVRDVHGRDWPVWEIVEVRNRWDKTDFGGLDYAILRSPIVYATPSIPQATTPLEIGEVVFTWQTPYGYSPILSMGMYHGRIGYSVPLGQDLAVVGLDFFGFATACGASGSPILNARGEAVEILIAYTASDLSLMGAYGLPLPDWGARGDPR